MATPPPLLRPAVVSGRGRAMVAATSIPAGAVLLTSSPILLYPASFASLSTFCSCCFRSLPPSPIPCGSCRSAAFCCPACASLSHPSLLCLFLSRSLGGSNKIQYQEAIFKNEDALLFILSAYSLPKPSFDTLLTVFAYPEGEKMKNQQQAVELHSLLLTLNDPSHISPFVTTGSPVEVTSMLLAIDKTNAFALREPYKGDVPQERRGSRAYGLYPDASLFNHDCLPNACYFDYLDGATVSGRRNTDIVVRALHDIPEGQEVCLSYFAVNWRYKERQQKLWEDFGFRCECDRCQVESKWKDDEDDDGNGNDVEIETEEGCEREEAMEEDVEGEPILREDDGDFPHAYFFARFLCSTKNCGGTMAPLPPSPDGTPSDVIECNICGKLRKSDFDSAEDSDGGMV